MALFNCLLLRCLLFPNLEAVALMIAEGFAENATQRPVAVAEDFHGVFELVEVSP